MPELISNDPFLSATFSCSAGPEIIEIADSSVSLVRETPIVSVGAESSGGMPEAVTDSSSPNPDLTPRLVVCMAALALSVLIVGVASQYMGE
jgi:hypothetical protein